MTTLLVAVALAADYTAYEFAAGNPLAFPGKEKGFHYALAHERAAERPHPSLWVSAAELAAARDRSDAPARRARKELERLADEALSTPPGTPDESWYAPLREKPFTETYPEIYTHTCREPGASWQRARALAHAWAITGKAPYRDAAAAVLGQWGAYGFVAEHYDVGLNYAIWVIAALECYDMLFAELSSEDHAVLTGFFERCLGALMRNDCFWLENDIGGGLNNHLAWHRYAAGAIACFYGEDTIVGFTLTGPRSLTELAERGLRDQGLWLEGSIPYHLTAQYPLIAAYRLYRRNGIAVPPLGSGRSFQDFFTGISRLVFPDLTLPPLGDAYALRRYLPDSAQWDVAHELWEDDLSAYMLSKRKRFDPWRTLCGTPPTRTGSPPRLGTELFPEHGYAVLRTPAGPPEAVDAMLITTYDAAGVHSNADELSFMLYARGRLWLEDREGRASSAHAFSADIQRTLNRHTICHNTLLVDWKGQQWNREKLTLVSFRSTPRFSQVTLADRGGRLYPGVRQLRSFILRPEYALSVLTVAADRDVECILPMHVHGTWDGASLAWREAALPGGTPWSWLRRAQRTEAREQVHARFTAGGASLDILSIASPAGPVWRIDFPLDDRARGFRPLLLRTTKGRRARFIDIFSFDAAGKNATVTWKALEKDSLLTIEVTLGSGRTDRYLLPN